MTVCYLAPDPVQSTFFIPGGNTPGNGAQVFFYVAGSSTKQTVYKDNAAATPWSNPIVLDSGGNLPLGGEVWFPTGQTFKVIWAPSNDTDPPGSPYRTMDNLSGMNDPATLQTSEWVLGTTPTFISASSFSVTSDLRTTYQVGRRVQAIVTAGTVYGTVTAASFGAGVTTVTLDMTNGVLDSGLSAVSYSILGSTNPSVPIFGANAKGASVSSAATTNIWNTGGDYVHITGTTAINSFSSAVNPGASATLIFDAATPINYTSTALVIPGQANITTAAGDTALIRSDTTAKNIITFYQRNSNLGAQAGEGIVGLTATGQSGGATKLVFQARRYTFRNASGFSNTVYTTSSVTVDTSVAGPTAGGRDQAGAFSNGAQVHVYAIWNGTTLSGVISTVDPSTGPTLPTGYTWFAYVGTYVLVAGGTNFPQISQVWNAVYYSGQASTAPTITSIAAISTSFAQAGTSGVSLYIPTNAMTMMLGFTGTFGNGAAAVSVNWQIGPANSTGTLFMASGVVPNSSAGTAGGFGEIPYLSAGIWFAYSGTGLASLTQGPSLIIYADGYRIPVGG